MISRQTGSALPPKILYVTYGLPFPPSRGASLRDFQLIRQAARKFRTRVVALVEQPAEAANVHEFSRICGQVETVEAPRGLWRKSAAPLLRGLGPGRPLAPAFYYSFELANRIREILEHDDVSLIQIEHSILAPHVEAADGLPVRKILSFHNLAEGQYRSMLKMGGHLARRGSAYLKWRLMNKWESRIAGRFDHCLTVSMPEREALLAANSHLAVSVVENGVDTLQIPYLRPAERNDSLLFVGNLQYAPNQDAVRFFVEHILPRIRLRFPEIRCMIAGAAPTAKLRATCDANGVSVAASPQDLKPFYEEATVCIVPLRCGGGTRLKILEAMAYGRPVVSTPEGSEGLNVSDERNILLAATPDAFAEQVLRLIRSRELAEKLASEARSLVERYYDWNLIGEKQRALYDRVLQS